MKFSPEKDGFFNNRRIEFFHHRSFSGRIDSFALIHPLREKKKNGLCVVFHSAGHDLYSCLGCTADELKTSFRIPVHATADVSLRRVQKFSIRAKNRVRWTFGKQSGIAEAGEHGLLTIPRLVITSSCEILKLTKSEE